MSEVKRVQIGNDITFTETHDGAADDDATIEGLGYLKAKWTNDESDPYKNCALSIAHAKPGLSVIGGGSQTYAKFLFDGNETRDVKFDVKVEYNVELMSAGGDSELTTSVFAYDLIEGEMLEEDKIRDASRSGRPFADIWSSSGTETEDIWVESVSPKDAIAVGTRVTTAAASGGLSTSYADAWHSKSSGEEYVRQLSIEIDWR